MPPGNYDCGCYNQYISCFTTAASDFYQRLAECQGEETNEAQDACSAHALDIYLQDRHNCSLYYDWCLVDCLP